MRVTTTKSKNSESFYINYAYIDKNGKSTSRIYKKLGTLRDLKEMLGTDDRDEVMKWAREQARIATEQHKAESESIQVTLSPKNLISINEQCSFNCGYLFLQKICTELRFDNICRNHSVLYYDRTNFFFEIEQEDELRTYGKSKNTVLLLSLDLVCLWMQTDFRLPLTSILEIRMSRQH